MLFRSMAIMVKNEYLGVGCGVSSVGRAQNPFKLRFDFFSEKYRTKAKRAYYVPITLSIIDGMTPKPKGYGRL